MKSTVYVEKSVSVKKSTVYVEKSVSVEKH